MSKRGWVAALIGVLGILFAATALLAQEVVKTKDGREVLLKADGTWVYITEEAPKGAVTPAVTSTQKSPTIVTPNTAGGGTTSPNKLTAEKEKSTSPTPKPGNTDTGKTTSSGQTIYQGPRGGCYHYSKSGRKVYAPCS